MLLMKRSGGRSRGEKERGGVGFKMEEREREVVDCNS